MDYHVAGISCNQPLNLRIMSGHLIEVDNTTLTIRYKFGKFKNQMFPSPIITVFVYYPTPVTRSTVYNMKLSLGFRPNGDSLNFHKTYMSIKWQVPGGEGLLPYKRDEDALCLNWGKIDKFCSPFGLLKTESHCLLLLTYGIVYLTITSVHVII